ncbi:MAG: hypothetical protein ACTSQY_04265 [Candidatus Odinarchaeia archaeon]
MKLTIKIGLIAILGALGIVLRTIAIPIFADVQLTPGMIAPILAGMLMGVWPGIATGFIIGTYAGLVSGEFFLIPLIGNICLGIGAGIVTEIPKEKIREELRIVLYVVLSAVIGGFLPTFGISLFLYADLVLVFIFGLIDMANAAIAALIAIVIWKILIEKFEELRN